MTPDISVVVPLYNEDESLQELVTWIKKVMEANSYTYEVVLIDDGSTDESWKVIQNIAHVNPNVKGIKFRRNYGKSAALNEGFIACSGNVVITMDADLQDSPDEIPGLYKMIKDDGWDLVSGWKKKRYDPISKTIPSKFFNWTTRKASGINNLHDFNCGLKAYKGEVVKNIEVYGEMHRYIPVIAKWSGFNKITEKVVEHRERKFGVTKFGLERFVNGFLDLMSIMFVSRFGKRPMHLFGTMGMICFAIGFIIAGWLSFDKYVNKVYGIADRPLFFFAILLLIIGAQLFLAGFLAEMIARTGSDKNQYQVSQTINVNSNQTINH
ncbi:MAG: glycosyltransferase [Bacteroidia bacterium]|nr:glycosyltransferase [Bacteroidia bacterium]